MYKVIRNSKYDFIGQSYAYSYPNLHKYPATMIPQIGIELFKELNLKNGRLLDPYCGSGSSFIVGLDRGFHEMYGFDINPLAVLISRAKFSKTDFKKAKLLKQRLRNVIFEFLKNEENLKKLQYPNFYNIDFWFSKPVLKNLTILKYFIDKIKEKDIRRLFLVPFSETLRDCSFTRSNEFKLYRIKSEEMLNFNPDVFGVFFNKLHKVISIYEYVYYPKLNNSNISIKIDYNKFESKKDYYDIVLTSPPYGDSKTTVAYGQFSLFSNEWLGIKKARKIDYLLMGGKTVKNKYQKGIITEYINEIEKNQ